MKICKSCVQDSFLLNQLNFSSDRSLCSICKVIDSCVEYPVLEKIADDVIYKHFTAIPDDRGLEFFAQKRYYSFGEICYSVFKSNRLASLIRNRLESIPCKNEKNIVFIPRNTWYEESQECTTGHQNKWHEFCQIIKYRQRFFNSDAKRILDSIFDDLDTSGQCRTFDVITTITTKDDYFRLYRGRIAHTVSERNEILKQMAVELGPPPNNRAAHGRMNPKGISFMYLSFERETCVSELRPNVGSEVVTGAFRPTRELRLLDLGKISYYHSWLKDISYFDPDSVRKRSIIAFLRGFEKIISAALSPQDSEMDYLPIQAFAEYLSNQHPLKLDGIIYPSSQIKNTKRNVALFPIVSDEYIYYSAKNKRDTVEIRCCNSDSTIEIVCRGLEPSHSSKPSMEFDSSGTKIHRITSFVIETDDLNCAEINEGCARNENTLFTTGFMSEANEEKRNSIKNR